MLHLENGEDVVYDADDDIVKVNPDATPDMEEIEVTTR